MLQSSPEACVGIQKLCTRAFRTQRMRQEAPPQLGGLSACPPLRQHWQLHCVRLNAGVRRGRPWSMEFPGWTVCLVLCRLPLVKSDNMLYHAFNALSFGANLGEDGVSRPQRAWPDYIRLIHPPLNAAEALCAAGPPPRTAEMPKYYFSNRGGG